MSYSLRTTIQIATMSARRTRRQALANLLLASNPLASSQVRPPMPSPPLRRVAPSVSLLRLDRTQIPSAPQPAEALHLHSPLRKPSLQGLASPRLWVAVPVHSADRRRSVEEVPLASLRPWVAAARLASPQVSVNPREVASAKPQEVVSASRQHWASHRIPSAPLVLASLRSRPNPRPLVALVSLHS